VTAEPAPSARSRCPICDGTGWKAVETGDVRRVARCDCWSRSVATRLGTEARIPRRYQHCTLRNFVTYGNESLERALARTARLIDEFPAGERGLFLLGPPGVGKTHLAVAALHEIIRAKAVRGLFFDTRDLLRVIRSTYDPVVRTTELEVIRPVVETDLLVLDDLGAEKPSEWVEETLNLIVNTRYNERRLTLFTSNYEDNPDPTDPSSLTGRIGLRMRSRLHEMCDALDLDGADYRQLPTNGGADDLIALWKTRRRQQGRRALPSRASSPARARRDEGHAELRWPGGRAGS